MKLLTSLVLAAVVLAGCTQPVVTTNPDGTTSTNHVVDPRLTTALNTAQTVNTATAQFNPWFPLTTAALGALAAIATAFATVKNSQKNKVQAQLVSVVRAVNDHGDAKTKNAIQERAESDGTEVDLHKTVKGVESGLL